MDLLEDLQISLLNFNSVMIYIIHKMLVLIKNNLKYLLNAFFRGIIKLIFFITYSNGKLKLKKKT